MPFRFFFTLGNLSKYGHITLSLSVGILSGLLQYFTKNRAISVQKLGASIKRLKLATYQSKIQNICKYSFEMVNYTYMYR